MQVQVLPGAPFSPFSRTIITRQHCVTSIFVQIDLFLFRRERREGIPLPDFHVFPDCAASQVSTLRRLSGRDDSRRIKLFMTECTRGHAVMLAELPGKEHGGGKSRFISNLLDVAVVEHQKTGGEFQPLLNHVLSRGTSQMIPEKPVQ